MNAYHICLYHVFSFQEIFVFNISNGLDIYRTQIAGYHLLRRMGAHKINSLQTALRKCDISSRQAERQQSPNDCEILNNVMKVAFEEV